MESEVRDMAEIWKDLRGYEGRYQVSSTGRIYSILSGKILKPKTDKDGYHEYCLTNKNGKKKHERGHRLVALMFCFKGENKTVVNHKNMVKNDNRCENLEWVSISENTKHAYENNDTIKARTLKNCYENAEKRKYKIKVFKNDLFIALFESQQECAESLGIDRKTIYNAMRENRETKDGYCFVKVG